MRSRTNSKLKGWTSAQACQSPDVGRRPIALTSPHPSVRKKGGLMLSVLGCPSKARIHRVAASSSPPRAASPPAQVSKRSCLAAAGGDPRAGQPGRACVDTCPPALYSP